MESNQGMIIRTLTAFSIHFRAFMLLSSLLFCYTYVLSMESRHDTLVSDLAITLVPYNGAYSLLFRFNSQYHLEKADIKLYRYNDTNFCEDIATQLDIRSVKEKYDLCSNCYIVNFPYSLVTGKYYLKVSQKPQKQEEFEVIEDKTPEDMSVYYKFTIRSTHAELGNKFYSIDNSGVFKEIDVSERNKELLLSQPLELKNCFNYSNFIVKLKIHDEAKDNNTLESEKLEKEIKDTIKELKSNKNQEFKGDTLERLLEDLTMFRQELKKDRCPDLEDDAKCFSNYNNYNFVRYISHLNYGYLIKANKYNPDQSIITIYKYDYMKKECSFQEELKLGFLIKDIVFWNQYAYIITKNNPKIFIFVIKDGNLVQHHITVEIPNTTPHASTFVIDDSENKFRIELNKLTLVGNVLYVTYTENSLSTIKEVKNPDQNLKHVKLIKFIMNKYGELADLTTITDKIEEKVNFPFKLVESESFVIKDNFLFVKTQGEPGTGSERIFLFKMDSTGEIETQWNILRDVALSAILVGQIKSFDSPCSPSKSKKSGNEPTQLANFLFYYSTSTLSLNNKIFTTYELTAGNTNYRDVRVDPKVDNVVTIPEDNKIIKIMVNSNYLYVWTQNKNNGIEVLIYLLNADRSASFLNKQEINGMSVGDTISFLPMRVADFKKV
jgi:hypothetical protein